MISSFCKNRLFIRGSLTAVLTKKRFLPSFKDVNFLSNYCMGIRYISGNTDDGHSFPVFYLINSCGISPQAALAASKSLNFQTPEKPDSFIRFFKDHGFSETQIRTLIVRLPVILKYNPEKNFSPKFQFFYGLAVSRSKIANILCSSPYVLRSSLDNRIIPSFNYFKDITHCSDDEVLDAYKRFPGVLDKDFQSLIAPNLAVLRECGVPESNISSKLVYCPRVFATSPEKFKSTLEEVKKVGFNPLKLKFLSALQALVQMKKSTWEGKVSVYKEWGWSDEEIASAFLKLPFCMMYSEYKIKAAMNFFVNTVGCKSSYIANQPVLLGLSLDKRLVPRWSLYKVLLSKGLMKEKKSHYRFFVCNENEFLQKFVTPYEDPQLLEIYKQEVGSFKTDGKTVNF